MNTVLTKRFAGKEEFFTKDLTSKVRKVDKECPVRTHHKTILFLAGMNHAIWWVRIGVHHFWIILILFLLCLILNKSTSYLKRCSDGMGPRLFTSSYVLVLSNKNIYNV